MSTETWPAANKPGRPTQIDSQAVGQHGQGIPEPPNVDARQLILLGGGALLLLSAAIFGLGRYYSDEVPIKTMPTPQVFPQPRVQPDEPAELKSLLNAQRQKLNGYHWADQQHTLVQIPIDRAMQIIAAKGAHGYDPIAAPSEALLSPTAGAERAVTPSIGPSNLQSGATANTTATGSAAPSDRPTTPPSAPSSTPSPPVAGSTAGMPP